MPTSLKVIALISGGKDSLFSILHCRANGHEVVALANLHPAVAPSKNKDDDDDDDVENEDEDINSYMYQTVGHNIIPLYAAALNLPLYRQAICGIAISTDKTYTPRPQFPTILEERPAASPAPPDETESLIPLLLKVLAAQPSANALSTGAILSSYQRTRVESVAIRLGLTPLSYLWQYPNLPPYSQTSLLEDMAAVGQDARIIKVASGGLDKSHLWMNVADPQTVRRLMRDMERFGGLQGGAVLGEGGEFETLAMDGPGPLWKQRIEVQEKVVVAGSGGSSAVRVTKARTVEKYWDSAADEMQQEVRIPDLLDADFAEISWTLREMKLTPKAMKSFKNHAVVLQKAPKVCIVETKTSVFVSNLTAQEGEDVATQVKGIIASLNNILATLHLTFSQLAFTTILLRSMVDFAEVNKLYSTLFIRPNPPARVTIACGEDLPVGVLVMLCVIVDRCLWSERRALHVQSRSYWAPANIGPYSQAVAVPLGNVFENREHPELVYVAGQIPLVPASMELVSSDFREQAILSLQHLWRIGRAMGVAWWTSAIAFITSSSKQEARDRAAVAQLVWEAAHERREENENSDIEDVDIGNQQLHRHWAHNCTGERAGGIGSLPALPDWRSMEINGSDPPPCFVVQVEELPRGASIEWSSIGLSSVRISTSIKHLGSFQLNICRVNNTDMSFHMGALATQDALRDCTSQCKEGIMEVYTSDPDAGSQGTAAMFIPCRSVWADGEEVYAAVRFRVSE